MEKILRRLDELYLYSGVNIVTWENDLNNVVFINGKEYFVCKDGKHKILTYCEGFSEPIDAVVFMTTDFYRQLIHVWANEKGLLKPENKHAQMCKVIEEVGELSGAMLKGNKEKMIDGIGDVFVTLAILCVQLDLNMTECIKAAYLEISDRKGKMVDGSFIKDGN